MANIDFVRAGGAVRRFHTIPMIGEQTVAAHSWGVIIQLFEICEPSVNLLRAAAYHDVAECFTGDIPAHAKWGSVELKEACKTLEREVEAKNGIAVKLCDDEYAMLKFADILDGIYTCSEQRMLGNRHLDVIFDRWVTFYKSIIAYKNERVEQAFTAACAAFESAKG